MNTDVYDLDQVERRRGRNKSEHTLFLSELLVGSQFSDNQFFNELVQTVDCLPEGEKPDQIVMSGLYMGDFGGRKKNSRWTLQPGIRDLDDQFRFGKEKLDQLRALDIPVIYTLSDNDQDIDEMTFEAFRQLHKPAKSMR